MLHSLSKTTYPPRSLHPGRSSFKREVETLSQRNKSTGNSLPAALPYERRHKKAFQRKETGPVQTQIADRKEEPQREQKCK